MNLKKYLPIGTVVLLKEATKRIMIMGFCCVDQEKSDKVYDYCGVIYPEGYLVANQFLMFNHDQIDKIFYLGLDDEENKEFHNDLNEFMNQQENK